MIFVCAALNTHIDQLRLMKLGKKVQEFLYSLSTRDKYAEFDSRKSFNRLNKPGDSVNLLYSHPSGSAVNLVGDRVAEHDSDVSRPGSPALSGLPNDGVHEVKLAWAHIRNWFATNLPDVNSALDQKATASDLVDLQRDLGVVLPRAVVLSYMLVDGQAHLEGCPDGDDGVMFGLRIMSLEEISVATENWRKIARAISKEQSLLRKLPELLRVPTSYDNEIHVNSQASRARSKRVVPAVTPRAVLISSTPLSTQQFLLTILGHSRERSLGQSGIEAMPPQRCIPPHLLACQFAHPMWIPLVTDDVGNYIGVDLCPDPCAGTVGQVILFGREWDCKFVVAENWGDFLLLFANDLTMGNCEVQSSRRANSSDLYIGVEGSLVFVDKHSRREQLYMDVLRDRSVEKWLLDWRRHNRPLLNTDHTLLESIRAKDKTMLNYKHHSADTYIRRNLLDMSGKLPFDGASDRSSRDSD